MESTPDVLEQVPVGGGVNKPESGTYGEKADLARLQAELPTAEPVGPQTNEVQPIPASTGGVVAPPAGLPRGLTAPTNRPDVPSSTPLDGPPPDPFAGAEDGRQRRLRLLEILAQHPDASPELQEWATVLKQKLSARG